jgi:FkbM family methyltransferase
MPKIAAILYWGKSTGWRAALAWALYRIKLALGLRPSTLRIRPRLARYPLTARLGSSDLNVFQQIFQENEYACMRDIKSPHLILDLGANVGYSSAYFLSCFRAATVVAVEPDPENYRQCRSNLIHYGARAQVVQGAVWSKCSRLTFSRPISGQGSEWGVQVVAGEPAEADGVDAWDIPTLLKMAGAEVIDILKVDIERSELEVFGVSSSLWLPKVRNICIELHGPDCEKVFFDALNDYDYDLGRSGELIICRNLRSRDRLPPPFV